MKRSGGRGKVGLPTSGAKRPMFVERVREIAAQQLAPPPRPPTAVAEGFLRLQRPLDLQIPPSHLPDGVVITTLTADDAAPVHALLELAYANGFGCVPGSMLDWWNGLLADSEFDRNLAFVAKAGDEAVGFCLCWTSSFVKDLVVAPLWRNRGIGTALLATALAALKARGATEVALKVDIYNGTAQRLYRQFGFSQD